MLIGENEGRPENHIHVGEENQISVDGSVLKTHFPKAWGMPSAGRAGSSDSQR